MYVLERSMRKANVKAASVHLAISCLFAGVVAILVFVIWFPYPYRTLSGGQELFTIVMLVDVVLGPALTLIVFDKNKTSKKLYFDLILIAMLQAAAMGYGIWTVSLARPVHLVFEIDRFRAVHAYDVPKTFLSKTPAEIVTFPMWGPTTLGLRRFRDVGEEVEATLSAMQGLTLSSRPDLWQPYEASKRDVLAISRPIDDLQRRFPSKADVIQQALKSMSDPASAVYLPLIVRDHFWTLVLDGKDASVQAYLPIDSF